jgi:DNA-binding MarR family transcriptional regulator
MVPEDQLPPTLRPAHIRDGRIDTEAMRRARMQIIVEQRLRGVSGTDLAKQFGVTKQRISELTKQAEKLGIVEEVRERMKYSLLPKAEQVYADIFSTDAASLADKNVLKGHELKLKAAKDVAAGLGAFKNESASSKSESKTLTLRSYYDGLRPATVSGHSGDVIDALPEWRGDGGDSSGADGLRGVAVLESTLPHPQLAGTDGAGDAGSLSDRSAEEAEPDHIVRGDN